MAPLMLSKQRLLLCIMAVVAVTPAAAVPAAASKRWMPTVLVQSDPPKPQLPGAYSAMWNLTEGKDAGGMVGAVEGGAWEWTWWFRSLRIFCKSPPPTP